MLAQHDVNQRRRRDRSRDRDTAIGPVPWIYVSSVYQLGQSCLCVADAGFSASVGVSLASQSRTAS